MIQPLLWHRLLLREESQAGLVIGTRHGGHSRVGSPWHAQGLSALLAAGLCTQRWRPTSAVPSLPGVLDLGAHI